MPETETVAKQAVSKLFAKSSRRLRTEEERPILERFKNLHAAAWGPPKVGKTHLGLGATTHAVYLTGKPGEGPFGKPERGELVIESKPMLVAFANFDRKADTVEDNLPSGYQFAEERFFETESGEQIWIPDDKQVFEILTRLKDFVMDASGECDLFCCDGATIIWDQVRQVRLPKKGQGKDGSVLPKEYNEANAEMRSTVMQLIYNADFNSWLTMEAGELWNSASGPVMDAYGKPVLRMDGWRRTGHYADTLGEFRHVELADKGWTRQYIPGPGSIKAAMIGQTIDNPTFAKIYERAFPNVPLLKREDRELYAELVAKHGPLMWG